MSRAPDDPSPAEPRLPQGVQSLESGIRVLQALGEAGGPAALKELAKTAGMSASKAHRHLVSLVGVGLAAQDARTGRYDLGPPALSLGLAALGRLDGLRAAEEALAELVATTGETGCLAVSGNLGPTIVSVEPSPRAVTVNVRIGSVLSRFRSASGLVLSAFLPAAAVQDLLAAETASGDAAPIEIEAALARVRRDGMAAVLGTQLPGVNALSAPVFDHRGRVAFAMTLLGPAPAFDAGLEGPLAQALRRSASLASRRLGFRPAD